MSILQRYFTLAIMQAVLFVLIAFLALMAFQDLASELPSVGKGGYAIHHAILYVLMLVPGHVYQVMPVAALIGTIYTMAQFASTSEFTIMRASSMSTSMAIWMLFKIGIVFVAITFLFGEVITPRTAPMAEAMKLSSKGAAVSQEFRTGMWTKDVLRTNGVKGEPIGSRFFNVRKLDPDGTLQGVTLYQFDNTFRLSSLITAVRAVYQGENVWRLSEVTETRFSNTNGAPTPGSDIGRMFGQDTSLVATERFAARDLVSEITPKILSVSSADPDSMSANELALYTRHLTENRQDTDRFKIAFWKKILDPLAIFVMMALALPFAYLHTRSGGVSLKIFVGIMIGVSFIVVNTLFSHLGLLRTWPPLLTAIAPAALFLAAALGALWWVERH